MTHRSTTSVINDRLLLLLVFPFLWPHHNSYVNAAIVSECRLLVVVQMGDRKDYRLPIRKTALALIGELGSESNAHGVARIVRSHDSRRKIVWSLLVLLGVGAAISQLSSLVHKYLQYQVCLVYRRRRYQSSSWHQHQHQLSASVISMFITNITYLDISLPSNFVHKYLQYQVCLVYRRRRYQSSS